MKMFLKPRKNEDNLISPDIITSHSNIKLSADEVRHNNINNGDNM